MHSMVETNRGGVICEKIGEILYTKAHEMMSLETAVCGTFWVLMA